MCSNCLVEVLTTTEAAEIWQRPRNTIQAACLRGVFQIGVDCRKSGRDWLVLKSSLIQHYGPPPNNPLGADGASTD